ncbi:lipoprotein releasing system transmembrane protein [Pseudobdellovibrio exovorus JSS]|uniref:Lipoprotein releasing system transmembrane protein n=1 Tax=Pseudobdellovibrio exovorus JSS TaxID=1184267 RepID=M4V7H0_9BACT|nr:lipoprotein releasing system transmembrane protein [Pseudobdellovibrio exovorus JSS]
MFLKKLVLSARSGALIRRITILSFVAITLSLTAFFIVLFVMNGMNRNIKTRIMALEPHLTTQHSPAQENDVKEVIGSDQRLSYQAFDLIVRTIDGQFRGAEALGYTTEGLSTWMSQLQQMRSQKRSVFFESGIFSQLQLGTNEVAMGIDLARMLGLLEGDEVTLIPPETLLLSSLETPLFQKVTVKRILATDLYDLDSKLMLFNSEFTLKSFSQTLSRRSGDHIWFSSVDKANAVQKQLLQKGIKSETWQEKNSDLFFALKMERLMIGTFLGLAGLIASSSILTVLALLMSQKQRDIAIIKTLGMSQQRTLWLFTKMGLWIAGGAIALGTILGVGISLYIEYNPVNILPNIYYDSSIPSAVDPVFVGIVLLVASTLAFLGSYLPAKTTLGIQPALLLRQKN